MDGQTVVAIVAAAIALVAMFITIWQAAEAKMSRQAAERQATAAERALILASEQTEAAKDSATAAMLSVDAAEKAANAAETQAAEARQANAFAAEALEHSRRDRDERDAPEFILARRGGEGNRERSRSRWSTVRRWT